ncbi:MAG: rRNA pseudouridine synthase, partial [Moorea sp. SIO2B7]|nr:rRNA pseudouridine synthase [Moorena sp. SIO2B7]
MVERVQKILSQWGIASRRQAEKMILAGRVRLNGNIVLLGQKADPSKDRLELDGRMIKISDRPQLIYLLLNKPSGVVSTCHDPRNRPTVLDLLPPQLQHGQGIHPVGRLDAESTGALILTNDGELTLTLTHPRYHLPKTYQVWVQGHPCESTLQVWRNGVILSGRKTLPAKVNIVKHSKEKTLLEIVLTEGRNRQIRRIANHLGFAVVNLHHT